MGRETWSQRGRYFTLIIESGRRKYPYTPPGRSGPALRDRGGGEGHLRLEPVGRRPAPPHVVAGQRGLGAVLGVVPAGRRAGDGREGVEVTTPEVVDVITSGLTALSNPTSPETPRGRVVVVPSRSPVPLFRLPRQPPWGRVRPLVRTHTGRMRIPRR